MKKFYNGYSGTLLTCTYFEYSSTFKSKVLVHVLEYLELVLVPNTALTVQYLEIIFPSFKASTVYIRMANLFI